jgi:hypothetical protein
MPGAMPPGGQPPPQPLPEPPKKPEIKDKKETTLKQVKHYNLTACEILGPAKSHDMSDEDHKNSLLEGEDVPGEYIPLIQCLGITMNIEGKNYNKGLIRDARDAARLVSYWETCLAETIALAPKAPWLLTPEQVKGFEKDFKNANVTNPPYMLYNPEIVDGVPMPPPMRQRPGDPPVALFTQASRATDNLRRVIGMFGSDVGEPGPERTGAAVYAKQKPSDVASYIFTYKLNRAIEHSAKVMNSMIAQVYDTERDVRLRDLEDNEYVVPINTTVERALGKVKQFPQAFKGMTVNKLQQIYAKHGGDAKLNDIKIGKYEVIVTHGPSYATARQESAAQLTGLIQVCPDIGKFGADIIVEPINEKLAARLRKRLPPGLVELQPGEQPFTPPMPPQIRLLLEKEQTEKLKQQTQVAKLRLELLKMAKESKDEEKDMKKHIFDTLEQLLLPAGQHPADQISGMDYE